MDINYLLAREQVSRMRALGAATAAARRAHAGLARGYATRLAAGAYPHQDIDAKSKELSIK